MKKKCHFCNKEIKEKEIGKDVFFCPRLRNYNNGTTFYGDWAHAECCKNSFFENIISWNKDGHCIGSCNSCDFPIGACLYAKVWLDDIQNEKVIIRRSVNKKSVFYIEDIMSFSSNYPNFKWDNEKRVLKVIPKFYDDSRIQYDVFVNKKLPTRIIITPECVRDAPLWRDLYKFYWSTLGHPQHFNKEEWMDKAPIVFGVEFLGKYFKRDENLKKVRKFVKKWCE